MYIFILRALNVAARFFKMCILGFVRAFSPFICFARILVWGRAYSTRPARIFSLWCAHFIVFVRKKRKIFDAHFSFVRALAF
jgi:hypothetical protein